MSFTISSMDFDQLPRYQPRKFLPNHVDWKNTGDVIAQYRHILGRSVTTREELEGWIYDRSELDAALDQHGAVLYIKMTCQTDNPAYSADYRHFIETIVPAVKPFEHQLNQKYFALREAVALDPSWTQRYGVYERALRSDLDIFREKNIPPATQIQLHSQEYQTICGAMTVSFQGKECTLPQVNKHLEEPDRSLRESAWRAVAGRRIQDRARLDDLFDAMLKLRHEVAQNAGHANFCEYQFHAYHRFDYTPQECKQYHDVVERRLVPVWQKILDRRRQQMKLPALRPWDLAVDPLGRPPLQPFREVENLVSGVKDIIHSLDPELGDQLQEMADMGLLDLANRKGKAPGGYQNTLAEARKPFIFMNAVGTDDDVRTLLHEAGHAFHAIACAGDPVHPYRHAPMEFCELASMSMELLGGENLSPFYNGQDAERARETHLEGIIALLIWVATIDAFQQWIYENPHHSQQQRSETWVQIHQRFGGGFLHWEGLENFRAGLWHRQLHIFEVPFYYIEYGIAQLGALQIWLNAKRDIRKTMAQYRAALALGGSRPLPELFAKAGLRFDFSEATIIPLAEAVHKELGL